MRIYNLLKVIQLIAVLALSLTLTNPAFSTGDAKAGKMKSATCVACHGQDGNSISAQFPKIAGQIPGYIASQLAAYKSGERQNAIMAGLVGSLSEQDMLDLDAYYSQNESTQASIAESELAAAKRGQEIYRRGLSQYSVPACMACHGPAGYGIPSRYPKLSGQYKEYTTAALLEFKSGKRKNTEMNAIAFRLSEQQIKDLAIYLQALN